MYVAPAMSAPKGGRIVFEFHGFRKFSIFNYMEFFREVRREMKNKILTALAGMIAMLAAGCYATVSADNIAIADVAPGSSVEAAIQKLGTPNQSGDELFFANGIVIEVAEYNPSIVEEIETNSGGATPAGISVGMKESVITKTYGNPDKLDTDSDGTEYTYYSADYTKKMEFKVINGNIVKIECELR